MLKEKAVSPRSHPTTWYIHTHVCFVHIYEYIYAEIWSIRIRTLLVSLPTPGLTSKYPIYAVCVCVCACTLTPSYTPTRVKNRKDTDNTSVSPFVQVTPYAKQ